MQGLFVPYARVGSGDPVRVLRLFHNKYSGYVVAFIYCVRLCTTCHYLDYVLTTTGCLCNSGLLTRDDVHCSASRGQLPGTVLYLSRTVYILGPFIRMFILNSEFISSYSGTIQILLHITRSIAFSEISHVILKMTPTSKVTYHT